MDGTVQDAPVDIVLVVDTSPSMVDNIFDVQNALDAFGPQLLAADLDVHVVLISQLAANGGICAYPPLGAGGCPQDDSNPPLLTRIDADSTSGDPLDLLLSELAGPTLPAILREGAHTHVAVITDGDAAQTPGDLPGLPRCGHGSSVVLVCGH